MLAPKSYFSCVEAAETLLAPNSYKQLLRWKGTLEAQALARYYFITIASLAFVYYSLALIFAVCMFFKFWWNCITTPMNNCWCILSILFTLGRNRWTHRYSEWGLQRPLGRNTLGFQQGITSAPGVTRMLQKHFEISIASKIVVLKAF